MIIPRSMLFAIVASHADLIASATDSFSLYAYGTGIPGLRFFYADGYAYVGNSAPSFAAKATNITLSLTSDSRFIASPTGSANWTTSPSMYIGADEGDIRTVGFVVDYRNASNSELVTDFGLFGSYAYNSAAGAYEMYFTALPINESGIYQVKWSVTESGTSNDIVPISLRTVPPATPSD